ncbi:hypothetical protein Hte_005235 [Hypoxylon texense]
MTPTPVPNESLDSADPNRDAVKMTPTPVPQESVDYADPPVPPTSAFTEYRYKHPEAISDSGSEYNDDIVITGPAIPTPSRSDPPLDKGKGVQGKTSEEGKAPAVAERHTPSLAPREPVISYVSGGYAGTYDTPDGPSSFTVSATPFLPVFPDPAQHTSYLFDGTYASRWIEDIEVLFEQWRVDARSMIRVLPHWTKDRILRHQVKDTISDCKTWADAKAAILYEYKTTDPRQNSTYKKELRELDAGPLLSDPIKIEKMVREYASLIARSKSSPLKINPDQCVESVLARIETPQLKDMSHFSKISPNDLKSKGWTDLKKTIHDWVISEVSLKALGSRTTKDAAALETDDEKAPAQSATKKDGSRHVSFDTQTKAPAAILVKSPAKNDTDIASLTKAISDLRINLQQRLDLHGSEIAAIRATHSGLSYAEEERRDLGINAVQRAQGSSFGRRLFDPTSNSYSTPRGTSGYGDFNNDCFFCGESDHRIGRCPLLRDMSDSAFIFYDGRRRQYNIDGRNLTQDQQTLPDIPIPEAVIGTARKDRRPMASYICQFVIDQNLGGDRTRKFAEYYLRKMQIGNDPSFRRPLPTPQAIPAVYEQPRVTEIPDEPNQNTNIQTNMVKSFGLGSFDSNFEYGWSASAVGPGGRQYIRGVIQRELEAESSHAVVDINAVKRRRGANGEAYEVDDQDTRPAEGSAEGGAPDLAKARTLEANNFWYEKVASNCRRNFSVTWDEMIQYVPGFSATVRNFLADSAVKAGAPDRIIRLSEEEVAREAAESAQSSNHPAKKGTAPEVGVMSVEMVQQSRDELEEPSQGLMIAGLDDPRAYFRPHLNLTVRVGPSGDENLITAVVDSGAESSLIAHSYVMRHRIPMRKTKVTWSGFGAGSKVRCLGVIEGPVWLAGQKLQLPMFVVEDHVANIKLLLGLNFIFQSRLELRFDGLDSLIGVMTFGSAKIEVPLTYGNTTERALGDFVGPYVEQGN